MKILLIMKPNTKNFDLTRISELVDFCKSHQLVIRESAQKHEADVIERFKKGHKIKIKKENVGSFTRYCGGNVTTECINRGKNSPDPKIRKKATFAQNARRWKH